MSQIFKLVDGKRLRKKVRAVIANDVGKFLLIQPHTYSADEWTLVGGGIEVNEDPLNAISREVKEEVGLSQYIEVKKSNIVHFFCFSPKIIEKRSLNYDGQIAEIFWIKVDAKTDVRIQRSEIRNFCWVTFEEAKQMIKVPAQLRLFIQVYAEFNRDNPSAA